MKSKLTKLNENRCRIAAKKFVSLDNIEEFRPVLYKFLTKDIHGKELCKELFPESKSGDIMTTPKTKPLIKAIEQTKVFRDASHMAINAPHLWKVFENEPGGMEILSQIFPEILPGERNNE